MEERKGRDGGAAECAFKYSATAELCIVKIVVINATLLISQRAKQLIKRPRNFSLYLLSLLQYSCLALLERLSFHLPFLLKAVHHVLVSPPNFMRESLLPFSASYPPTLSLTHLHSAVFASWLQPQHAQRLWHNHPLLSVIWWRNALKELEPLKCSCPPCRLMRNHTADGSV